MDGPALTRLAWELGLAPKEVGTIGHKVLAYLTALTVPQIAWQPHMDLTQADAVFRQVRQRGWTTSVAFGYGGFAQSGMVHATKAGLDRVPTEREDFLCPGHVGGEETEALALLRCACLAAASEPLTPTPP